MTKEMLSKHISIEEMRCECGCKEGKYPQPGIVILLELVRAHFGNKYNCQCVIKPTSGNRCVEHNEEVQEKWYPINHNGKKYIPFSSESTHMEYAACDFKVKIRIQYRYEDLKMKYRWAQIDPKEVYEFIDNLFPNSLGLGLYDNRNHADIRSKRARWGNS